MTVIELNAFRWGGANDFYEALLTGLGSPHWHGRNVNAIVDSMIFGEINAVEQPFRIIIRGLDGADRRAREELRYVIAALVREGAHCHLGRDGTATVEVVWPLSRGTLRED